MTSSASPRSTSRPGPLGTHRPGALPAHVDVVVVGAGIVGLAHALAAHDRGMSVLVVERDEQAVGASVRNFGHGCFTAQDGPALTYALAAREQWLRLAKEAGFWLRETGTVVVARADDELAVLDDFTAARDGDAVLLDPAAVLARVPVHAPDVVGGAFLPLDVRVDPREAVGSIAAWLGDRPGVRIAWSTSVQCFDAGSGVTLVRTSRGEVVAKRVVLAVGHDVDRFFPDAARDAGVERCTLRMLRVTGPGAPSDGGPSASASPLLDPAVLTGTSLLRYDGFAASPAADALRDRLARSAPEVLDAGLNLMLTQRPDGTLTLGDTHAYATTPSPFQDEVLDDLLLREGSRLLGGPLRVLERWRGVYASAPAPFLVADPMPGVRVVSVTSGIGMTTALGLAPRVLDDLFPAPRPS